MTIDIAQLKKISQSSLKTMVNYEETAGKRKRTTDDRFWKCTPNEAGNGTALIRFLPALKADQIPFVQTWSYFVKASTGNKWYVNKSRRTLNEADPMQEYYYRRLESAGSEEEKAKLRQQFRASNYYIANILVINDPAHPENNGKVFLYRFGKKILTKITDKLKSEFADEEPINVFDWLQGCNFKLRMSRNKGDYPNYDSSEFQEPSAMTDEQIGFCAEHLYDLNEFIDPSTFKSYDELKREVDAFAAVDEKGSAVKMNVASPSAPSAPWTPSYTNAPTTTTASAPKIDAWDDGYDSLLEDLK